MWINRLLDDAHEVHRVAVLLPQVIDLAGADAVFAGAGAIQRNSLLYHLLVDGRHFCQFLGVGGINGEDDVIVAISDMARMAAGTGQDASSSRVKRMHSPRADTGTQTSDDQPRAPGLCETTA